jgi:pimeloyl-ACP methyl ester carboxylesterase
MSTLTSATYTFDPRPELPLLFTVKRLWNDTIPEAHRANGFTIILLHGTGFHKELWEPTIDDLFALLSQGGLGSEIRDVWTIDSPNHGDSAILNEQAMKFHETVCEYYTFAESFCETHITVYIKVRADDYGKAIHAFLNGYGTGLDVDFSGRKLIAVGHSAGCTAL